MEADATVEADADADGLPDEYELQWADDLDELSGLADADADGDESNPQVQQQMLGLIKGYLT